MIPPGGNESASHIADTADTQSMHTRVQGGDAAWSCHAQTRCWTSELSERSEFCEDRGRGGRHAAAMQSQALSGSADFGF